MNIQFPQPEFWTDQKTGMTIRLYSLHHIREYESQEAMKEMCRRKKIAYVDQLCVPTPEGTVIQDLIA